MLMKFNKLAVVIDPHNIAQQNQAISRGCDLAQQQDADITLISVIKPPDSSIRQFDGIISAEEMTSIFRDKNLLALEELAKPLRSKGLEVSSEILIGREFIEIIKYVLRHNIDAVVKVARLQSQRLLGNDLHLLRKCPCPVWLIREPIRNSSVLATIDLKLQEHAEGKAMNLLILNMAKKVAQWDQSKLFVLSCWTLYGEDALRNSSFLKVSDEKLQHMLNTERNVYQWRQKELAKSVDIGDEKLVLTKGNPDIEIPAFISKNNVSTVVMGTIGRTGVPGLIIGNTAEMVLSAINTSVIAVKPEGFVSPVIH